MYVCMYVSVIVRGIVSYFHIVGNEKKMNFHVLHKRNCQNNWSQVVTTENALPLLRCSSWVSEYTHQHQLLGLWHQKSVVKLIRSIFCFIWKIRKHISLPKLVKLGLSTKWVCEVFQSYNYKKCIKKNVEWMLYSLLKSHCFG